MKSDILRRNNVTVRGQGTRPMLFAHGFGCDQNMWRLVARDFERDHRVVLLDYVGCGKSDLAAYDPVRYGTLDGYAQDILDVCDALDLQNVIFVGHSVSSMIGVLASIRDPFRFSRLVLVGPSARYVNDTPDYVGGFERSDIDGLLETMDSNFVGWAQTMAPAIMGNHDRPELGNELAEAFCSTDPDIARRFAEVTFLSDNRRDLPKVTVPSLIMQCSDDIIAPLCIGDYLHRQMQRSTLRVLQATGHCPQLSHPDETIAVMRDYLAGTL